MDRSDLVNQFPLDVLDPQRTSNLKPVLWKCLQTFISQAFVLKDWGNMVRIEPFSGGRLITIISKPLCDPFERPPLLTETNNRIVKKVLVFRVRCRFWQSTRGKCRSETEVIFNLYTHPLKTTPRSPSVFEPWLYSIGSHNYLLMKSSFHKDYFQKNRP